MSFLSWYSRDINKGQHGKDRDGSTNNEPKNMEVQQSGAAASGSGNDQQYRGGKSNYGYMKKASNERSKYDYEDQPVHVKQIASFHPKVKIDAISSKVCTTHLFNFR